MHDIEFVGDWRQPQPSARQRALGHDGSSAGDFTFGDFLDIINPLQHIPLVSTLYREITGDEISPHARILGDTLFGGPSGFLSSIATVLYEEVAGEDIGETVIAFFRGETAGDGEPQFAGSESPGAAGAASPGALPLPLETAAGQAGMLTGQAALDALFRDLSRSQPSQALPLAAPSPAPSRAPSPAAALPDPPAEARAGADQRSYSLPPRDAPDPAPVPTPAPTAAATAAEDAVHPLLFAQETAGGALADRMMQALDKYEAMARERVARNRSANSEPEAARWQSDPAAPAGVTF